MSHSFPLFGSPSGRRQGCQKTNTPTAAHIQPCSGVLYTRGISNLMSERNSWEQKDRWVRGLEDATK